MQQQKQETDLLGKINGANKSRNLVGCGSADMADALKGDFFLSIQSYSQIRLTRSLPPRARVGKVAELIQAVFHPDFQATPALGLMQAINRPY